MGRLDYVLDITRGILKIFEEPTQARLAEVDAQADVAVAAEEAQSWYMARIEQYRKRILDLREVYNIGRVF